MAGMAAARLSLRVAAGSRVGREQGEGTEHRPGGGPGAADRGLGLLQRGFRPDPPPVVGGSEGSRGVGDVIVQCWVGPERPAGIAPGGFLIPGPPAAPVVHVSTQVAAGLSPARVHQITAGADLDALDAALGELRAAGWPAPEDPGGDDDAELDGRDLICDRLVDEAGSLRQCAGWLTHLHASEFPR